jgi:hypothetical protein
MMRSKIKTGDLRDRIALHSITLYNSTANGVPTHTYNSVGLDIWAMVRRGLSSTQDNADRSSDSSDKTKVVSNFEITVRIESIVYKVEDKIIWDDRTMYIKDIQQIDNWYQKLICYHEY